MRLSRFILRETSNEGSNFLNILFQTFKILQIQQENNNSYIKSFFWNINANIDDRVTENPKLPKTQTHERNVVNDGQPKHRYVQQTVPARYGPSTNFTSIKS